MNLLTPAEITLFILAIAILLGTARILGEIARYFNQPAVLGEILAGIVLGPTLLGRLAPELKEALFPTEGNPAIALQALFVLAVTLFLLVAGLEVDLSTAFRQGKAALSITAFGMVLPFLMGFGAAWAAPGLLMEVPEDKLFVFALFFATALSISALPVIAKILKDLNLMKTDLGVIVVASATVNDLIGWIVFAIVLGLMGASKAALSIQAIIGLTLLFVFLMLTVGRWVIHRLLPVLQAHTAWPAGTLGFALTGALLCAAFTEYIGIHAIFGAFIFGVALGDSRHLRERTRHTLDEFISFIFAPLFFASIGLQVDFIAGFDLVAVLVVLVLAIVGKVVGCVIGARIGGMSKREAWAIGFAKNARGAMEIILGLLALQYGVINESLFVALVVMALVTSMLSGTLMEKALRRRKPMHFSDFLAAKRFVPHMKATSRQEAIEELTTALCAGSEMDPEAIIEKAWKREQIVPTGLPNEVAIPHARIDGIDRPVIALGIAPDGIDFDSPDGKRAKLIFLIATPVDDAQAQLEVLSSVAAFVQGFGRTEELRHASSFTELMARFRTPGH